MEKVCVFQLYNLLPVSSEILKNSVYGFPSETKPYLIVLGLPRSPSSACTCRISSPGFRVGFNNVVGGARVKTGGVSCTSRTATKRGQPAMFLVSFSISVYGSCSTVKEEQIFL